MSECIEREKHMMFSAWKRSSKESYLPNNNVRMNSCIRRTVSFHGKIFHSAKHQKFCFAQYWIEVNWSTHYLHGGPDTRKKTHVVCCNKHIIRMWISSCCVLFRTNSICKNSQPFKSNKIKVSMDCTRKQYTNGLKKIKKKKRTRAHAYLRRNVYLRETKVKNKVLKAKKINKLLCVERTLSFFSSSCIPFRWI